MTTQDQLQSEIGKHYIQPNNYGKIEDADGIGVGREQSSNTYVIMYLNLKNRHISDIKFFSNSTQDVNALGSIFTEMVKGDEIHRAEQTAQTLEDELQEAYSNLPEPKIDLSKAEGEQVEYISTQYQDSANMVLTSFRAALRHAERKKSGIKEEYFDMNINKSCPYSGTDCHFMQTEDRDKEIS